MPCGPAITVRYAWTEPALPARRIRDLPEPRNNDRAGGDDLFVEAEVIPPAERRDMVRRLLALCHTANDLVAAAEAGAPGHDGSSAVLLEHAQRIQAVLRDTVVDLVANGHAHRTDAA